MATGVTLKLREVKARPMRIRLMEFDWRGFYKQVMKKDPPRDMVRPDFTYRAFRREAYKAHLRTL